MTNQKQKIEHLEEQIKFLNEIISTQQDTIKQLITSLNPPNYCIKKDTETKDTTNKNNYERLDISRRRTIV